MYVYEYSKISIYGCTTTTITNHDNLKSIASLQYDALGGGDGGGYDRLSTILLPKLQNNSRSAVTNNLGQLVQKQQHH